MVKEGAEVEGVHISCPEEVEEGRRELGGLDFPLEGPLGETTRCLLLQPRPLPLNEEFFFDRRGLKRRGWFDDEGRVEGAYEGGGRGGGGGGEESGALVGFWFMPGCASLDND